MLAFDQSDNTLDVHLISDILAEISGTLSIRLYDLNGKVLRNQAKEIRVEANSAKAVKTIQINEWLNGFNLDRVIVYASLIQYVEVIDDKEYFLFTMKDFTLPVSE